MSIQDNLKPNVKIIAVSKTFELAKIKPLIDHGHDHFGENKLQEAQIKWSEIIKNNKSIKLHMIGKLQSNKAKKAVDLFHYIHSLDNQKLSDVLSRAEKEKNNKLLIHKIKVYKKGDKYVVPVNQVQSRMVKNFFETND